jgi:1-acyl-sn-glycerol-3-phosphate acyltransferase
VSPEPELTGRSDGDAERVASLQPAPKRPLLRTVRLVAVVVATVGMYLYWILGYLVTAPFGRWRRWRDHCISTWCRALCSILGVRIECSGQIPRGGCLIVANHLGYLDVLVLGAVCPTSFVAKAEVGRWPGIGLLCRSVGVVFVPREERRQLPEVARMLGRELEHGGCVVVFPEGTSTPGDEVLAFRPSLLEPAVVGSLPIAHASLGYRTTGDDPPARESVCWWGDMEFVPHVNGLMQLRGVGARVRFGDEPIVGTDRKALAQELHDRVAAGFQLVTNDRVPPTEIPGDAGGGDGAAGSIVSTTSGGVA